MDEQVRAKSFFKSIVSAADKAQPGERFRHQKLVQGRARKRVQETCKMVQSRAGATQTQSTTTATMRARRISSNKLAQEVDIFRGRLIAQQDLELQIWGTGGVSEFNQQHPKLQVGWGLD